MRHLRKPLTWPVYGDLQHEINDMIIAIKLHYGDLSKEPNQDSVEKARAHVRKPTFENMIELFARCRDTLDKIRENSIKY